MLANVCLCLLPSFFWICLGLSEYFPDVKNLRNAKMKNGGLEAQRVPDLLFWLVFAIGTEGEVVPNVNTAYKIGGVTKHFNPTSVILSSLVACLELLWYCRCPSMSVVDVLDTIEETVKDTSTSLEVEFPVITSPSVNVPTMFASSNSVTDCIPSWNVITSLTVAVAPELAPVII